jgi:hypothetical protein
MPGSQQVARHRPAHDPCTEHCNSIHDGLLSGSGETTRSFADVLHAAQETEL